jgi:hypothetical protein
MNLIFGTVLLVGILALIVVCIYSVIKENGSLGREKGEEQRRMEITKMLEEEFNYLAEISGWPGKNK